MVALLNQRLSIFCFIQDVEMVSTCLFARFAEFKQVLKVHYCLNIADQLFTWLHIIICLNKKRHNVLFSPVDYIGVVGIQVEKLEVYRGVLCSKRGFDKGCVIKGTCIYSSQGCTKFVFHGKYITKWNIYSLQKKCTCIICID